MPVVLRLPKAARGDPSNRITTCKTCRLGIFRGQPYTWSRQPTGLIHTRCAGGQP
jgi:hypothetical protein